MLLRDGGALVSILGVLADWSGVLGFALVLGGLGWAQRVAVSQMRLHIQLAEFWAAGHDGEGWREDSLKPADKLRWSHPRFSVVKNFSAGVLTELGLHEQFLIRPELMRPLASVAQSLESLNQAIERHESFKVADLSLYLSVQGKLSRAMKDVLGSAEEPPDDLSQDSLNLVITRAGLTDTEMAWMTTSASLLQTVHVVFIGDRSGKGLCRHVHDLRLEFDRWHG